MSADKKPPSAETDEALVQEGLTFLHQARDTRGLHPWQVDLIERRLFERGVRSRRMALWPALAALALCSRRVRLWQWPRADCARCP